MGSTYFPTKKGTDPNVQVGQAPSINRQGGTDAAGPGAQDVINQSQALINAFVHAQRQNVANSTTDHHQASQFGPDFDIHYTNYRGQETIQVDPHPTPAQLAEQAVEEAAAEVQAEVPGAKTTQQQEAEDQAEAGPTAPKTVLMVLYGTSGIAAFDMAKIGPSTVGTATYKNADSDNTWVTDAGMIVPVGQFNFGGTGWILCPLNFGGATAAQSLRLSTTKLVDSVATQADLQAVPVMNSPGSGVFTPGGAYSDATGSIQVVASMAIDGTRVVQPTVIDSSGLSYFFPQALGADIFVRMDAKSELSGYGSPGASFGVALAAAEKLQQGEGLDDPIVYTVYETTDDTADAEHSQHDVYSGRITIIAVADPADKIYGFVDGQSFYGENAFGLVPVPAGVAMATSQQQVEVFVSSENHTDVKMTPVGSSDNWNLNWPVQAYTFNGSADSMSVVTFPLTGMGTTTQPVTANTDKSKFTSLLTGGTHFGYSSNTTIVFDPSTGDLVNHTIANDVNAEGVPGATYPPLPGIGGNAGTDTGAIDSYYDAVAAASSSAPNVVGTLSPTITDLVYDRHGLGSGATYNATGDFATPDEAPFPPGTAATSTSDGSGAILAEAATDQHWPYAVGSTTGTFTRHSEVQIFGIDMTYTKLEGTGIPPTTLQPPLINVHAWPPAFSSGGGDALPWFTYYQPATGSGGDDEDHIYLYTPYDSALVINSLESFTPWMHVSNGTHCLQAYYIDGVPHGHLDGSSNSGFIDACAAGCGCDATDIVAVFMDIELAAVKALAGVNPPDYSASVSPAPGLPT